MAEDKAQLTPSLSTEDKLLQSICKVGSPSELLNLGDWRGWKSYAHQVIFESDQNFYKIYERGGSEFGEFYSVIRNNLADIYRELGISWEVMTVLRDGVITDVEKRQRLKVLTREDMSFKDALASFSVILEELEKRLEFQDILNQLKQFPEVSNVERLKLMRLCVNKYEDYAIFNDQVVLLDDTDWCIALVDHEGEPVSIDCKFNQTVYTTYGNFVFVNHFKNVRMEADAVIWHEKSPTMYRDKWWILRALDFNNSSTELKRDLSIIEADSHYSDRVLMDGLERKLRENIALMRLDEASKSQEDHFLYDEYEVGERTVMVYKLPLDAQGMRTVAQWNLSCDTCVNLADRSSTFENASTRPLYEDLLNLRDELDRFDDFGCDTISFKGNFFEGVLEPKLVKRAFYDVLRSCHELRKTGKLKRLCIEVSLKKGAQTDLYKALDFLETLGFDSLNNENGNGLWLCTHWNPKPFISEREMKNWKFQMKNIYNYYPWLRKHTELTLTQELCETYLKGLYDPHKFAGEYKTSISYRIPDYLYLLRNSGSFGNGWDNSSKNKELIKDRLFALKEEVSKRLGDDYLPKRNSFRNFLAKYARDDRDSIILMLNAQTNNIQPQVSLGYKSKAVAEDDELASGSDVAQRDSNPFCRALRIEERHALDFSFYSDSNDCALCDIEQIILGRTCPL